MRRRHTMPFGAECLEDGRVGFHLWAPKAQRVDLYLEEQKSSAIAMQPKEGGWYELVTERANLGSRYRFQIDGATKVPDPASRFQPLDVHGPSEVIDPESFNWKDENWCGRPWEEVILYELHVGTFTSEGTFRGVEKRLDYLAGLGVTAIELMPVADFPGTRNWGYDGVVLYAPDSQYGRPEDLKHLIESAHAQGLMMFLDVVYNHFGPEGNYLHQYAPQFFSERHRTPWGSAINMDGPDSRVVRDFFIHNALYWLTEYHFDGLRLDAVDAIADDSSPHILTELAETVRDAIGTQRQVHLVLENDRNTADYLERASNGAVKLYNAQWNDDIHHSLHVAITGEKDGYYSDYADCPLQHLGRCLTEGFDYQGQASPFRHGATRGQPCKNLPSAAFVSFLQNHDQVGNRAFGERIGQLADPRAVRAATAILLLAPSPPLLFMGEEFGADTPFLFFCDFEPDLARAVTEGRRNEFLRFARFSDPAERSRIPDPSAVTTFESSKIPWGSLGKPPHDAWYEFYRDLLKLRLQEIVPRIPQCKGGDATFQRLECEGLAARWKLAGQLELNLVTNLSDQALSGVDVPAGELLYTTDRNLPAMLKEGRLPAWSTAWFLKQ